MPVAERPLALTPTLRRSLVGRILRPVDLLFVVIIVICASGVRIPDWLQYLPFALSLVFFGLPHGALDHLVPARLAGIRPTARSITHVVLLYAVLGAPVFAIWMGAPAVAFVGFIALTLAHWGLGDLYSLLAIEGVRHLRNRLLRVAAVVIRGALPMLVPLIAFPAAYAAVAAQTTGVFGGVTVPTAIPDSTRVWLAASISMAAAVYLIAGGLEARRIGAGAGWRRDATEIALLAAFFALVPPILAVGLYFSLWHALRHIVRLGLLDRDGTRVRDDLVRGDLWRAVRSFARDAAPVTAIAIAMLVVLAILLPPSVQTGGGLGLYLVLISALTVPHTVIVAFMDRRQGLWSRT